MYHIARKHVVRPDVCFLEHNDCTRKFNYFGHKLSATLTLDERAEGHFYFLCLISADGFPLPDWVVEELLLSFFDDFDGIYELPTSLLPIGWRHIRQFSRKDPSLSVPPALQVAA